MTPQNKPTVKTNNAAAASAIKNFVTDILITPVIRNICVLNPKKYFPKRTPIDLFLLNFSSVLRGGLDFPGRRIWLLL
jgi:hypothetical protein